jgi:putative RNA 2'-phosphotransferase
VTDLKKINLSKFLTFILRHHPEEIGLKVDAFGWADIEELIFKSSLVNRYFTISIIKDIMETEEKKRFIFSEDLKKIRAIQGHSFKVELEMSAIAPPPFLYHGTNLGFLEGIKKDGLQKMKRHHVHLSANEESARLVARRRKDPTILIVESGIMHQDGFLFYCAVNGVWLTDNVPPKYITFAEL